MQRNGERADEDRILALAAHGGCEAFAISFAEALDRSQLEVPARILLVRGLVSNALASRRPRPRQDGLQYFGIVRHDTNHIYALRNQILDRPDLQRRVRAGRTDHEGLDAQLIRTFLDPGVHGVEPWDTANLHDDADDWLV